MAAANNFGDLASLAPHLGQTCVEESTDAPHDLQFRVQSFGDENIDMLYGISVAELSLSELRARSSCEILSVNCCVGNLERHRPELACIDGTYTGANDKSSEYPEKPLAVRDMTPLVY